MNIWNPQDDGATHINIYSKAKTRLGFLMSNFTNLPIETSDGHFTSIEGYWYWLGLPESNVGRESLRLLHGFEAKKQGRALKSKDWQDGTNFKNKILEALRIKVNTYWELKDLLTKSTLPFTHYYVFSDKVITPKEGQWIIDWWEDQRKELQNN